MRRKITTIIAGVLAVSMVLGGCGKTQKEEKDNSSDKKTEEKSGTVTLKVWGATDDQEILAEMVESFKQKYAGEAEFDITIEAVEEGDCKGTLLADVQNGADVFAFADDQLMALVAGGALVPVDNVDDVKNANMEGAVEAATVNDVLYGYPMTADNGYFMYYDKSVFSEADVTTLDQMLSVAAAANKKVTIDLGDGYFLYTFFGNTGLNFGMNDDGVTMFCDWNTTEGPIKGVDIVQAVQAIVANPGFQNGGDTALVEGARNGTVAAGISGVWNAEKLKAAWGDNYAAVKLPTYTCAGQQIQMASFCGYKMVGVNAYSENKEWGLKLADWLTNEENQKLRFEKRGLGPSNTAVAGSSEVQSNPAIMAVQTQLEYATLQRVGGKYWALMQEFGDTLAAGKNDVVVQELLDNLVKAITASAAN